jgi:cysteine desulfurase / selenocysteine lyase
MPARVWARFLDCTSGGPPRGERAGLTAFSLQGVHPHDLSTMLDQDAIAIRAGHHCTQILHQVIGEPATARASYYFYNTRAEIDRLAEACEKARTFFS